MSQKPPPTSQYELSDDENIDRFITHILPDYSAQIYSVPFPRIAIVAGQPGSGKSYALEVVKGKLGVEFFPLTIDKDNLALSYHPFRSKIRRVDNLHISEHTNADANKWRRYLLKLGEISESNMVLEHALNKKDFIEKTIRNLRNSAYGVDLHCVAVNSKTSAQGIILRYTDREFLKRNTGRIVYPLFHNKAYVAYPAIAQYLENKKLVDTISVYSRSALLFKNSLKDGVWEQNKSVKSVIDTERNRIWTPQEKYDLVVRWNVLDTQWKAFLDKHHEPPFPKEIYDEAVPFIEEARLFAKAVQATSENIVQSGVVTNITSNHIFVLTEDRLVAYDRNPLVKPKFDVGDAWLLKSRPAARTVGGRFHLKSPTL